MVRMPPIKEVAHMRVRDCGVGWLVQAEERKRRPGGQRTWGREAGTRRCRAISEFVSVLKLELG